MKSENNKCLKISTACVLNETMWAFLEDTNALCKIDLASGKIDFISHVPEESTSRIRLYGGILSYKDKLILIPESAREVAIYDISCKVFSKFKLEKMHKDEFSNEYAKFFSGVITGDKLYLIPRRYPALVEINLETRHIKYYTEWVEKFEKSISVQGRAFFKEDVVFDGQKMYFCSPCNPYSMEFDIMSKNTKLIDVGYPSCNVFNLNGRTTYLFADSGRLWNSVDVFDSIFPSDFCCGPVNFNKSFDVGDMVYFAPCKSNQIMSFDKKQKTWRTLYSFKNGVTPWRHMCMANGRVYFYDQNDATLHILYKGEWVDVIALRNVNQLLAEVYKKLISMEQVDETECFGIDELIQMI